MVLAGIPVYYMDWLAAPYPPINSWIYETDVVGEQWRYQIEQEKLADNRQSRKPLVKLDISKLEHNVGTTLNAIF
jgi:hypothetical protein